MKHTKRHIPRQLLSLLPLCLFLSLLFSCSNEMESGGGEAAETVTVSLCTGVADGIGTKATHEDVNAVEGEFMYSLTVFVCDADNRIVKKLDAGTLSDAAEHSFSPFELKAGTYSFYAFANCENTSVQTDILKLDVEDKMPDEVVNNTYSVANPHINLDFKTIFTGSNHIPMTGRLDKSLSADETVTINMVRLVSRIQVSLYNKGEKELTIKDDLMLNDVAENVSLFKDGTVTDNRKTKVKIPLGDGTDLTIQLEDDNALQSDYLYIPESRNEHKFTLTIEDKNREGFTPTAILRNTIQPFEIYLKEYVLVLSVTFQNAPIGGYTVNQTSSGGYDVGIPEGSTFSITAKLKKGEDWIEGVTWTRTDKENEIPINNMSTSVTDGNTILTGAIPAIPTSNKTTFTLNATATNINETFDVTISVTPLKGETKAAPYSEAPAYVYPQFIEMNINK